ncbi:hypothetical protein EPA93_47835 [Ktedonosporobacter rubrisoli]|uniref:Uncharacterized protein n=1 Tax=Ktedonosporobacter rubrisoli TaxID=2509675 RepID=A0A4P6K5V3_KTERU|nr:hypothetical protein [Ktedonosporobacter rubrisoli]QBD83270.1 hypothetical protein EPA93_47835 [Ktedonosporobacter rubrisoli]
MGKDSAKYRYIEAAILRGSPTLMSIEKDAAEHHMSEHMGKLLALRIADYYKLAEALGTYSVEGILATLSYGSRLLMNAPVQRQVERDHSLLAEEAHPQLQEEITILPADDPEENASMASEYWNTL